MALALSRHLRRAIPLSSHLLRPLLLPPPQIRPVNPVLQTRLFKSSPQLLNYRSDFKGSDENRISPDEILFEGCDYKHWLITMDFPKDPAPSPEEMVETYVQTCAKVLGSVEEAKRRIYACSTTTYQGFQVEVDEETSEKFRGLPGVVFILPDSYLYPETKEYGGDKYENGVITPRPPPIQYSTQNRRRERNRFEQSQNRPFDNQQGNLRNYPSQQGNFGNYPPQQPQGNLQNYPPNGPIQHGGNLRNYPPNEQQQGNFPNYPPNQQGGNFQNYPPNQQQGNFQNYPPNQQQGNFQNYPFNRQGGNLQNYPPNRQGGFENYPPQQEGNLPNYPPQRGRDGGYQRDYNQGQRGNFAQGPTPGYGGDEGWKERR